MIIQRLVWLLIRGCEATEPETADSGYCATARARVTSVNGPVEPQRSRRSASPEELSTASPVLAPILNIFLERELYYPCSHSASLTCLDRSPSRNTVM